MKNFTQKLIARAEGRNKVFYADFFFPLAKKTEQPEQDRLKKMLKNVERLALLHEEIADKVVFDRPVP